MEALIYIYLAANIYIAGIVTGLTWEKLKTITFRRLIFLTIFLILLGLPIAIFEGLDKWLDK